MAGHMQKRGESTWRLHAFIGQSSDGRRRYASKTFHGSKKQASTALAAFVTETEKDRNTSAAAEPMTVSLVLEKWLNSREGQLSPATTALAARRIDRTKHGLGALGAHLLLDVIVATRFEVASSELACGSSLNATPGCTFEIYGTSLRPLAPLTSEDLAALPEAQLLPDRLMEAPASPESGYRSERSEQKP
jgi:hypothetical protein